MTTPSYVEGRTIAICPACGKRYQSNEGWSWYCFDCGPDAQMQCLIDVAQALADATAPSRTCPHDGCLVLPGEMCPACRVRDRAKAKAQRLRGYSDTEHDPKRPIAWRPNGRGIQVPVYEQSEVA